LVPEFDQHEHKPAERSNTRLPHEERIGKSIEEWYSGAYVRGVRMSGVERLLLARFLAQREEAARVAGR
jgi:hypothetical protein